LYFYIGLRRSLLYFIVLFAISACVGHSNRKKERSPQPVEFAVKEHSLFFKEDLFKVEIDTLYNMIHICLTFKKEATAKFPYPTFQNDTLTGTVFDFSLWNNGKMIRGAGLAHEDRNSYFQYNKYLSDFLQFNSDTIDMKETFTIPFFIPMYAVANLHAGINEIELKIGQSHFFSADKFEKLTVDSSGKTVRSETRNFKKLPLISGSVIFKLNVPKVFKTTIYNESIELRNDSVYSPAGMDNTIWNSSYPDIYWTIDFPGNDLYCRSDYKRSTSLYDIKDTFYLYHYTPYDSVYIGVWDHDDLSRDDYISYERFSLAKFKQNAVTTFSFDNIKEFKLKADRKGYINK
jgi:hypothetical protein